MGVTPIPTTGPNSTTYKPWFRKNAEARVEMILHVEVDQLAHMSSHIASEIWEELERVHRARGLATRLALRRTFLSMRKKSYQPMYQWIANVRGITFRLRSIGVTIDDEDLILVITMGLPPAYTTFVVALDSTPSNQLTIFRVFSMKNLVPAVSLGPSTINRRPLIVLIPLVPRLGLSARKPGNSQTRRCFPTSLASSLARKGTSRQTVLTAQSVQMARRL